MSPPPPEKPKAKRFHGGVRLDSTRVGWDECRIADEDDRSFCRYLEWRSEM